MYLANKVQNIQGSADTLLDLAELTQDEIRPVAEAMERGGRLAAKAEVTDAILDKCKPIAGTPADCIAAIEEYRDAGCTHVMLELWGDKRHDQIRLFGEKVLPHVPRRELRPGGVRRLRGRGLGGEGRRRVRHPARAESQSGSPSTAGAVEANEERVACSTWRRARGMSRIVPSRAVRRSWGSTLRGDARVRARPCAGR